MSDNYAQAHHLTTSGENANADNTVGDTAFSGYGTTVQAKMRQVVHLAKIRQTQYETT